MAADKIIEQFLKENPEFPGYLIEEMRACLPKKVTDEQVKKILEVLKKEYENSLISPYESIGIITAQSVGEPATQMTLNTFHFAGVESLNITMGLPRIIEVLDAKKNLSTPLMWIYLKDSKNKEKVREFAIKIKEIKLNDIAKEVNVDISEKKIIINLEKNIIDKIGISEERVKNVLSKAVKKGDVKVSPDKVEISFTGNISFKLISSYKEILLNTVLSGINGIEDATVVEKDGEYVIMTRGTALSKLSTYKEIDLERSYSNNINEIEKLFGIEAARNLILMELKGIVEEQGLSINERHLMLLADVMTYTGEVKGITRYGIVAEKLNVLTRASFETPIKHIAQGALYGEVNELTSITENVMTNQMVNVGTGIPKIKVKNKKENKN